MLVIAERHHHDHLLSVAGHDLRPFLHRSIGNFGEVFEIEGRVVPVAIRTTIVFSGPGSGQLVRKFLEGPRPSTQKFDFADGSIRPFAARISRNNRDSQSGHVSPAQFQTLVAFSVQKRKIRTAL